MTKHSAGRGHICSAWYHILSYLPGLKKLRVSHQIWSIWRHESYNSAFSERLKLVQEFLKTYFYNHSWALVTIFATMRKFGAASAWWKEKERECREQRMNTVPKACVGLGLLTQITVNYLCCFCKLLVFSNYSTGPQINNNNCLYSHILYTYVTRTIPTDVTSRKLPDISLFIFVIVCRVPGFLHSYLNYLVHVPKFVFLGSCFAILSRNKFCIPKT